MPSTRKPKPTPAALVAQAEARCAALAAEKAQAAAKAERDATRAVRSRRILDEDARVRSALSESQRTAYAAREAALEGLDPANILDLTATLPCGRLVTEVTPGVDIGD